LLLGQAGKQLGRRFTMRWIHPHVEGTGLFVAEAAIGTLDLHRRHTKVRKDQIHGRESLCVEHARKIGEVPVSRDECSGAEAGGAQTSFRARQLEAIEVESDQASARLQVFQDRLRMPAAAERAVNRDLAGRRLEAAEHFIDHDRSMRAGRRLVGGKNLLHVSQECHMELTVTWYAKLFSTLPRLRGENGRAARSRTVRAAGAVGANRDRIAMMWSPGPRSGVRTAQAPSGRRASVEDT
jgi:hypothetical protein